MWQGPFGIMRPSPLFSSTRALTSISLSLSDCSSLWVLLWTHIVFAFHLFPYLSSLFSPSCILNFLPIAILLSVCFGKNEFPGLLCFSNFSSFVQVSLLVSHLLCLSLLCVLGTKPIVRYIPLASVSPLSLLTFRLVSNLSPYPLSTIVLLSGSPAFGTERKAFLLFPFFPYLFL